MEESALNLEALLQQQARSFETLKRHCNSVKRVLGDQITVAGLQNRLQRISRIWELCVITDTQIQNLRTPSSKDPYFLQKHFEEAEEFFLTYNDYILKSITELENQNAMSSSEFTSTSPSLSSHQHHQATPLQRSIFLSFPVS